MKKIILLIFTATLVLATQAQTPRVSYFMDKYTNRHQRNPALSPAWGYVNFPGLGGLNGGTESNLKLTNFLYPKSNGELTTFMNPDVDADKFLKKVKKRTSIGFNINENILGFGFYRSNDKFYSFDLNVKAEGGVALPKDLFAFFKNAESGNTYNISNMNFVARAYVEAALGHARDINENLRVGGKLKFLIGGLDARILLDETNVVIGGENEPWKVNTLATGTILGQGMTLKTDSTGAVDFGETFDDIKYGIGGFGGAIDLGASYKLDKLLGDLFPTLPLKGFTVSFGLTDLGFIKYSKAAKVKAQGEVIYDGFKNISFEGDSISVGDEWNQLKDEFKEMIKLRPDGEGKGMARGLRTTANLGIEYSFLNDKISAGLLWSTHFGYPARYTDVTLSCNLRPSNWFSLSLSTTIARAFNTIGWAINLTPKYGLAFFIGMDYVPLQLGLINDLPVIPLKTGNINVNFGMSIPIGKNCYKKYLKAETAPADGGINERSLVTE